MYKLFIANLDYAITLEELQRIVSEYCTDCTVELPRDRKTGEGKGFAFAIAQTQESQEHLMERLNNCTIKGRPPSVKKFSDSPRARISRRDEEYNEQ